MNIKKGDIYSGKIIKGIGGFYYVHTGAPGVFACRARGIFRKENRKPLVGDDVRITVTDVTDMEGSVDELLPRRNELIRPAAANVDQAMVIFALENPKPNYNLLDRFLISMRQQQIPVVICLNKTDLVSEEEAAKAARIYALSGSPVMCFSVEKEEGLEAVRSFLDRKTTIVAGPSGVGKSSLTNFLSPQETMETGEVSRIRRGRHTTRHTQLIWIGPDTYFLDTPGFSSLYLQDIEYEQLPDYYPEFEQLKEKCRFQGCMHLSEPDCAVKEAVEAGQIHPVRYENYRLLAKELKERKKY